MVLSRVDLAATVGQTSIVWGLSHLSKRRQNAHGWMVRKSTQTHRCSNSADYIISATDEIPQDRREFGSHTNQGRRSPPAQAERAQMNDAEICH